MKAFSNIAMGGLMLAGAALGVAAPANAGVAVGVTVGGPGVAVGVGSPCFKPYRFRPAYCGYPVYGRPLFVDGAWYRGPVYVRTVGGERYFWLHDGWVRDRGTFHRVVR
ncbi:MAG TPA: hypothetical protein VHX61_07205 [Rhizomicrobium sp.]|jgi:hypothetical protein|nr:hypothetical protein [Rhizomicrobium sp.]